MGPLFGGGADDELLFGFIDIDIGGFGVGGIGEEGLDSAANGGGFIGAEGDDFEFAFGWSEFGEGLFDGLELFGTTENDELAFGAIVANVDGGFFIFEESFDGRGSGESIDAREAKEFELASFAGGIGGVEGIDELFGHGLIIGGSDDEDGGAGVIEADGGGEASEEGFLERGADDGGGSFLEGVGLQSGFAQGLAIHVLNEFVDFCMFGIGCGHEESAVGGIGGEDGFGEAGGQRAAGSGRVGVTEGVAFGDHG